jgi:hypothetical protein
MASSSSPSRQKRRAERRKNSDALQWSDEGVYSLAVPMAGVACINSLELHVAAEISQEMPVALQIHAPLHDWTVRHVIALCRPSLLL